MEVPLDIAIWRNIHWETCLRLEAGMREIRWEAALLLEAAGVREIQLEACLLICAFVEKCFRAIFTLELFQNKVLLCVELMM